jgi:kinesin family protein 5
VKDSEVYELMRKGNGNRSVAATNMNAESSRSHSLFVLTITMTNNDDGSCKTGKLFLVDLAGSEKIQKTGAVGQTLEEAKNINKSLTTLGKVIVALTDKKATHVPYRESKLTRILSESLGGNSKTTLICTISRKQIHQEESLQSLKFA